MSAPELARRIGLGWPVLLALLLLAPALSAREDVSVGLYLLNVGKFDVQTGSFSADFYLSMRCPTNCSPANFEFANGRATSTDLLIDKPNEKFWRISGQFQDPVDLRGFPLDQHAITIELEDKTRTAGQQVYRVDAAQSGVDPAVQLVGWRSSGWNATVSDHFYAPYNETFSKYVFSVGIEREFLTSALKTFVPVLVILLLNWAIHFPDPDKIVSRIGWHVTLLMAAVMFHVAIAGQIPPVGYLTLADKFMLAAYVPLAISMLASILLLEAFERKDARLVDIVHHYSGVASFLAWILAISIVILTI